MAVMWVASFRGRPVSLDVAADALAALWGESTTVHGATARLRSKGYSEGWVDIRVTTDTEPSPEMLAAALAVLGGHDLAVTDVSVREEQR